MESESKTAIFRHMGAEDVARSIDRIQRRIKQADPTLTHVFVEAESLAALGRGPAPNDATLQEMSGA